MNPDRWQRVKLIFDATLKLPPGERLGYLADACDGDDDLRREVESLLDSFDQAQGFMEQPAVGEAADQIIATQVRKFSKGQSVAQYRIISELGTKQYDKNTLVNSLWLPTIRAALEMTRQSPAGAIEQLQSALRYEAAGEFWPQYIRGLAYLKMNKGTEAAAEFQRILDHRGQAPLSILYSLAHRGLADATALRSGKATARKLYEDFFAHWKDADSDLPVLIEAKKRYANLKGR